MVVDPPPSHLSIWHCSPEQVVADDGQTWSAVQVPIVQSGQVWVPPQPLPMVPQYWPPPAGLQLSGVHSDAGAPHTPVTPPPPQVWGAVQLPQSRVAPQPSPTLPQNWAPVGVQVRATQLGPPVQMLLVHTPSPGQVPQSSVALQPLPMT